jgi:hypothetical protein
MTNTYPWLADRALDRTMALGEEMAKFLLQRDEQKKIDPSFSVQPHSELLRLLDEMRNPDSRKV